MKTKKIIYWTTTVLVSVFMLMSSYMYLSHNPHMMEGFQKLGYPLFFAMLLGTAKLLGAIALIQQKWKKLQEWAYAGFTFTFIGAIWTHISTGTSFVGALIALIILGTSYVFRHKLIHM